MDLLTVKLVHSFRILVFAFDALPRLLITCTGMRGASWALLVYNKVTENHWGVKYRPKTLPAVLNLLTVETTHLMRSLKPSSHQYLSFFTPALFWQIWINNSTVPGDVYFLSEGQLTHSMIFPPFVSQTCSFTLFIWTFRMFRVLIWPVDSQIFASDILLRWERKWEI